MTRLTLFLLGLGVCMFGFVGDVHAQNQRASASAPAADGFDRAAAAEALKSVDVLRCKTSKGPTGEGHVVVTFLPTGSASQAALDKGPFAGTKVGKCVTKAFKRAKVPPFKGDPINVGKLFKID